MGSEAIELAYRYHSHIATCKICEKEFHGTSPRSCLCSERCRKINKSLKNRNYRIKRAAEKAMAALRKNNTLQISVEDFIEEPHEYISYGQRQQKEYAKVDRIQKQRKCWTCRCRVKNDYLDAYICTSDRSGRMDQVVNDYDTCSCWER